MKFQNLFYILFIILISLLLTLGQRPGWKVFREDVIVRQDNMLFIKRYSVHKETSPWISVIHGRSWTEPTFKSAESIGLEQDDFSYGLTA